MGNPFKEQPVYYQETLKAVRRKTDVSYMRDWAIFSMKTNFRTFN